MASLPVIMASIVGGAIVIDYGVKHTRTAIAGAATSTPATSSTTAPSTPAGSSTSTLPTGGTQHGLVSMAALAVIGARHGWTGQQLIDWMNIIMSESNGTLTDTNTSSGAYGIAQFINGPSEYATYGGDATTLTGQLTAMANYIAQRYGNPSNAWTFHQAHNWY